MIADFNINFIADFVVGFYILSTYTVDNIYASMIIFACLCTDFILTIAFVIFSRFSMEYEHVDTQKGNFIYWGLQHKTINLFEPQ
jgi:hypothetical protein